MKAYLVLGVFVALILVVFAENENPESTHKLEKRGTIIAGPVFPRCVFYECIAKCRQKGFKSGGYCTINGCQCLR